MVATLFADRAYTGDRLRTALAALGRWTIAIIIGRTLDFYVRGLGMVEEVFGAGRRALRFGRQKINLYPANEEAILPRAARPGPGTADICLVAARPLAKVEKHLREEGFAIEDGPVSRTGATGPIRSIYLRDPDGNLVEVSEYM